LAEKSGVSKSTISMAERAVHTTPPKELVQSRLARGLGITLEALRNSMPAGNSKHDQTESASDSAPGRGVLPVRQSKPTPREMDDIVLPATWINSTTDNPQELRYYMVSDMAMQPTLRTGDVVITGPIHETAPGLYLVGQRADYDSLLATGVRRIIPAGNGKLSMSCDSELFDRTQMVIDNETILLARVLSVIRKIEPE
jgi:transcriptional regulator with XRE-family HTH domain